MSWKIKDEKVEKAIKALFLDDKSYQEAIDYGYEYAEAHEHKWLAICGGTKFGIKEMIGNICVEISLDNSARAKPAYSYIDKPYIYGGQ